MHALPALCISMCACPRAALTSALKTHARAAAQLSNPNLPCFVFRLPVPDTPVCAAPRRLHPAHADLQRIRSSPVPWHTPCACRLHPVHADPQPGDLQPGHPCCHRPVQLVAGRGPDRDAGACHGGTQPEPWVRGKRWRAAWSGLECCVVRKRWRARGKGERAVCCCGSCNGSGGNWEGVRPRCYCRACVTVGRRGMGLE